MPARSITVVLLLLLFFSTPSPRKALVVIPAGASAFQLAESLTSAGVLIRKEIFLKTTSFLKIDKELKYGSYEFFRFSPVFNIVSELKKGESVLIKVTIPEGWRSDQIAERLEAQNIVGRDEFLKYVRDKELEGYLFPETYYLPPASSPSYVCAVFKKQFDSVFSEELIHQAANAGLSPRETLILAGIIEKEAKSREEKFLISGIFHNRLKKRMRLESCATVRFAIKKWSGPLSIEDTLYDSPYNTYRHRGLPPSPISNPGKDALEAAANPMSTDLLFFVVDSSGEHNFSKYFDQHREKKFQRKRNK